MTTRKIVTVKLNAASNRPSAGRLLFAHTMACLEVLGMLKKKGRKAVRVADLSKLMGATAVSHHTRSTGFFSRDDEGRVILTEVGLAGFAARGGRLGFTQRTDQIAESKTVKEMVTAIKSGGSVLGVNFDKEVALKR